MKNLKISSNGRYLTFEDATPFFYLGDTAWEMFQRLTEDEAKKYLKDRAGKGFNVIQSVVLSETSELSIPNVNGDLALVDNDLSKPNEAYFKHVDTIVEMANQMGLVVGMLPTWGIYWKEGYSNRVITSQNAYTYGKFIGQRYKDADIIWILGGDQNAQTEEEKQTIRELAKGLRVGDEGNHLITYHPIGPGRSAEMWHNEEWLDFNMNQTSHGAQNHFNGAFATMDYQLVPVKPTLDGEPRYEQMQIGFYNQGCYTIFGKFNDFDARQAAYWSVFSGSCGHTYGNHNIYQMWTPDVEAQYSADIPWYEAIHHPGARQMGYMRRLMESIHFEKLEPSNGLLVNATTFGGGKTLAVKANDDSVAAVYSPYGNEFTLDLTWAKDGYQCSWFNPKYGSEHVFFSSANTLCIQTFAPPTSGRGEDWVLVIRKN